MYSQYFVFIVLSLSDCTSEVDQPHYIQIVIQKSHASNCSLPSNLTHERTCTHPRTQRGHASGACCVLFCRSKPRAERAPWREWNQMIQLAKYGNWYAPPIRRYYSDVNQVVSWIGRFAEIPSLGGDSLRHAAALDSWGHPSDFSCYANSCSRSASEIRQRRAPSTSLANFWGELCHWGLDHRFSTVQVARRVAATLVFACLSLNARATLAHAAKWVRPARIAPPPPQ